MTSSTEKAQLVGEFSEQDLRQDQEGDEREKRKGKRKMMGDWHYF
jgi:hypothetical protein